MKTSEFKKRAEELGYQVESCDFWIDVSDRFGLKGTVFTKDFRLALSNNDINLIKLCLEYTLTPFEEREDEKKYRVRIPDSPERTPVYALCKLANGCVVINQTNESNFQLQPRYHLTESEIKRNHEYLWQFAKEVKE